MRSTCIFLLFLILVPSAYVETGSRSRIYRDLTHFWAELRQNRERMREIYLEQPQFQKSEKIEQGSALYKNSRETLKAAHKLVAKHRKAFPRDSVMLRLLESRIDKSFSELRNYAIRVTRLSPLELHARSFGLRIGKLLEKRKFMSMETGSLVSGAVLVERLKDAYFFFHLKSKATLTRAEKTLSPLVDEFPSFLPGLFWLARIYFEQERVEEAGSLLNRILEQDPDLKIGASLSERMLTNQDYLDLSLPKILLQNAPPELAPTDNEAPKQKDQRRVPFVIAIANSKQDRPQSGLDLADRIYELPIEGGETTLLACYGLIDPASVPLGPITSVSAYFLEEVFPLNPLVIHKGSSPGGERVGKKLGIEMIDQNIGYDAFWEVLNSDSKPRIFTSMQRLKGIAYTRGKIPGDVFRGVKTTRIGHPYGENQIRAIHIPFAKNYTVSYRYSQDSGRYLRSINGVLHRDAWSGTALEAENIVIQMVEEIILSPSRSKTIRVIGTGKLHSFVKGKYFQGTWRRASIGAETRYYDGKGQEVFFLPGKIWIHFLSNHSSVRIETWKKVLK
jgi:tetratricopeptide (TPR) repeat protein